MNSLFDNLNLRPGERRLIVGVAIVTFIVLNFWFVWPHKDDWRAATTELNDARDKLEEYQDTAGKLDSTSRELSKVESGGAALIAKDESVHLLRTIQTLTTRHKVTVSSYDPQTENSVGTNDFFIERTLPIRFNSTDDTNLVNFLVAVGSDESLIRVRDLIIQADRERSKLEGRIALVASYRGSGKKKESQFGGKP